MLLVQTGSPFLPSKKNKLEINSAAVQIPRIQGNHRSFFLKSFISKCLFTQQRYWYLNLYWACFLVWRRLLKQATKNPIVRSFSGLERRHLVVSSSAPPIPLCFQGAAGLKEEGNGEAAEILSPTARSFQMFVRRKVSEKAWACSRTTASFS